MNEGFYLEILRLGAVPGIMSLTMLVVLFVDLGGMRQVEWAIRQRTGAAVVCFGCLAAFLWTLWGGAAGQAGMLVMDPVTVAGQQIILVLTAFVAGIGMDRRFTEHVGEFYSLLLLGAAGMLLMVSTENLLLIFVSLELTSLSLYVMTAFDKRNTRSAEAALKYFLFGSVAAAFGLFGFSLLYGLTGTVELREIAARLEGQRMDALLGVALVMTLMGLGFKIAAVPFHLWAPDAYQGAPSPSAAFIASGSKAASFILLAKVVWLGFGGAEGSGAWRAMAPGWAPLLAMVAALSMVLGNVVALGQRSVKRLLGYSAVAHAGYALLGILANSEHGMLALLYYVATYGMATLGAFGVLAVLEGDSGDVTFENLRGLARRAPGLAGCLLVFVLSLAGIPPLAGFFGKFYLFVAVLQWAPSSLGMVWLVALAIAMSAVSLYYYLQVLKQVYLSKGDGGEPDIRVSLPVMAVLGVAAVLVIVLGCLPELVLGPWTASLAAGW
jgi:NADH-quinone oxidoreductase subunit N